MLEILHALLARPNLDLVRLAVEAYAHVRRANFVSIHHVRLPILHELPAKPVDRKSHECRQARDRRAMAAS